MFLLCGRGRPTRRRAARSRSGCRGSGERLWAAASARGGVDLGRDRAQRGCRHHSTAIEGNTLVLREVQRLLAEGKAVGSKELAEYLELRATRRRRNGSTPKPSISPATGRARERALDLTELRQIHRLVVDRHGCTHRRRSWATARARVRSDSTTFIRFTGGMTPPSFPEVPALVTDCYATPTEDRRAINTPWCSLLTFTPGSSGSIPSVTGTGGSAAWPRIFFSFGRVIRLRSSTSGIARVTSTRRRADRGDPEPLAEMVARAVTDGIHRFLLPGLAGPHRLVPSGSLADAELSGNALAVAAKRGRLRAVRRTDQWYSSRQWVEEYKQRRYQRT